MSEKRKAIHTKRLTVLREARLNDCVVALDWSATGAWLAAASIDGQVMLFSQQEHAAPQTFMAHPVGMGALAWHPERDLLVTAGQDGFVRAWSPDGSKLWEYRIGRAWIEKLAWSPQAMEIDGQQQVVLAVAHGKEMALLDADGHLLAKSESLGHTLTDLCWYPHGPMVLAAAYGGLYVFHGISARRLRSYDWKGAMWNCRWSPDGRWVVGGSQENAIHLWEANSGEHLHMPGYQAKIRALAWSHDGHWLGTGNGMDVLLWDCSGKGPDGRAPRMFGAHGQSVTDICFQHQGNLFAAAGKDGNLMLWQADGGPEPAAAHVGGSEIGLVRWSPDDKLLAMGTAEGEVIVF